MNPLQVFLRRSLKNRSLPIYINYFVTDRCPANCHHCFNWPSHISQDQELTLDELNRIAVSMDSVQHINFTGGEPFLRDDLSQLAAIFTNHCKVTSFGVATNGFDPDRIISSVERILAISQKLKLRINVSLDHRDETYDVMRNCPGLFLNAVQTIRNLMHLKSPRLTTGVNLIVTKANEREIVDIYDFIRDELRPDRINPLYPRGVPRVASAIDISVNSYRNLLQHWLEDIESGRFRSHPSPLLNSVISGRDIFVRKMILHYFRVKKLPFICLAGSLGAVLRPDGEVAPCEILPERFGSLRNSGYDLRRIWFSELAMRSKRQIQRTKCACSHECFLSLSALLSVRSIPSILKEVFVQSFAK